VCHHHCTRNLLNASSAPSPQPIQSIWKIIKVLEAANYNICNSNEKKNDKLGAMINKTNTSNEQECCYVENILVTIWNFLVTTSAERQVKSYQWKNLIVNT